MGDENVEISKLKLLREKHKLSREELGNACGLSMQRIYELETLSTSPKQETQEKLAHGMVTVILQRQADLDSLHFEYVKHRDTLLDRVEETAYEL